MQHHSSNCSKCYDRTHWAVFCNSKTPYNNRSDIEDTNCDEGTFIIGPKTQKGTVQVTGDLPVLLAKHTSSLLTLEAHVTLTTEYRKAQIKLHEVKKHNHFKTNTTQH